MPKLDHVAIWVADLVGARDFYVTWFAGTANDLYHNPRTGLQTYILSFDSGARLEIMTRPDVTAAQAGERFGWAHISFAVENRTAVDTLAARLRAGGVEVVDGPRLTGDGYYEAVLLDPEGNRVEIVAGDYSPA